jgi:hypothetical protein
MYPHKLLHALDNDNIVIPSLSVKEYDLGDWEWEASRASDPQPPPKVLIQEH